jgi:hypothetical protein
LSYCCQPFAPAAAPGGGARGGARPRRDPAQRGWQGQPYFLRGFDLDHGTDFATVADGVPVNMPTHAHDQGYSGLNFLIPELIERIDYRKGVYYAEEGDFSAAGRPRSTIAAASPTPS